MKIINKWRYDFIYWWYRTFGKNVHRILLEDNPYEAGDIVFDGHNEYLFLGKGKMKLIEQEIEDEE